MTHTSENEFSLHRILGALTMAAALTSFAGCAVADKRDATSTEGSAKVESPAPAAPVVAPTASTQQSPATKAEEPAAFALKSDKERKSYAMGMSFATQFRKTDTLDSDAFVQGLKDSFSGSKTLMTEAEARTAVASLQNDLKKQQLAGDIDKRQKNQQEGEAFLAANKSKEGVVTLDSGLQYKIIKAGNGKKPQRGDAVVCHYRGMFVDGKEFDSSYKRNAPATFTLDKVMKGWSDGLQLMPVGSKWQLFIPPDLAYGEKGAGRTIGPNSTLIFEVELVSIKDAAEAKDEGSVKPAVNSKRKVKAAARTG